MLPEELPLESWHGVRSDRFARFCVVNLRNSGQTSRAIYALSRMIFHHNSPQSVRAGFHQRFLDSPPPNTGFNDKSALFS